MHHDPTEGWVSAAVVPLLPEYTQTYGRYQWRFRADSLPTAGLVFLADTANQTTNPWPGSGEIDFPEAEMNPGGWNFNYRHADPATNSTSWEHWTNPTSFTGWHIGTLTWVPGRVTAEVDGVLVGTSTTEVPADPLVWLMQCGSNTGTAPASTALSAHIQIDWIVIWSYAEGS
jgi:beta-glucanase (GH16 family)